MIAPSFVYKAVVLSVYDGDTMTVVADIGFRVQMQLQLRLLGIDAPEMGTAGGKPARDHLRSLCTPPLIIHTYKDPGDKYGRWLAEIFNGEGRSVNAAMVTDGHAVPYDGGKKG
jgi:micrococcal nuclease